TPVRYHEVRCRADVRFPDGTREVGCSYHNPWYQRWFMEPIDDGRLVREKLREHTRKLGDVMVMYCDEESGRKGPVSAKDV
ncbi:hypothetical protein KY359_06535, partial [Candidatus Woesearchaeota archaeon]|nr:hypothetical protein [Candidatus Woesearchaeota archaeon]